MTVLNTQELSIIQAFASSNVPERVMRESKIRELIRDMTVAQSSVQSDSDRLEALRKEKKEEMSSVTGCITGTTKCRMRSSI